MCVSVKNGKGRDREMEKCVEGIVCCEHVSAVKGEQGEGEVEVGG